MAQRRENHNPSAVAPRQPVQDASTIEVEAKRINTLGRGQDGSSIGLEDIGSDCGRGVCDAEHCDPGSHEEYAKYRRLMLRRGIDIDADEISDEWWQTGRTA